jgi:hypothetical protein
MHPPEVVPTKHPIKSVFGSSNEVIHFILTPHFFIWFVK